MEMDRADQAVQQEQYMLAYSSSSDRHTITGEISPDDRSSLRSLRSHGDFLSLDCFSRGAKWSAESYQRVKRLLEARASDFLSVNG